MAILLNLSPSPHPPVPPSKPSSPKPNSLSPTHRPLSIGKRQLLLKATILGSVCLTAQNPLALAFAEPSPPPRPLLSGISNTRNWFQFYGDGFSIRVPPEFEDVSEPEDFNAGLSLYGDKAKTKEFAARFASHDGSEVLNVLIRPTNQLKITFLEAQDVADLGSLKEVAKIFVPGGSTLYAARTIKIKDEEDLRTYYFYEFGRDDQHVALVAAVKSGKEKMERSPSGLVLIPAAAPPTGQVCTALASCWPCNTTGLRVEVQPMTNHQMLVHAWYVLPAPSNALSKCATLELCTCTYISHVTAVISPIIIYLTSSCNWLAVAVAVLVIS